MAFAEDTYMAGNRFGLGLRPGEAAHIASDPRNWLHGQLAAITQTPPLLQDLPFSADFLAAQVDRRMDMQRTRRDQQDDERLQQAARENRRMLVQDQQDHALLRIKTAINTDTPFAERLVHFWSNHFTVAVSPGPKAIIGQIALSFEQEAIRSNLDKSFLDLLLAVEQHPAMLVYLDNAVSVGPDSLLGKRRDRGLNENLAREILELHTLGVNGGYSQADVTSLARMITGWTVSGPQLNRLRGTITDQITGFTFVPQMHDDSKQMLLGKTYRQAGVQQGEAALADLAAHPATARHIAEKLARHFISDSPPESAVDKLESVFLDTGGNLPALHAALVEMDEAWLAENRKLKTPHELVVSTARALDLSAQIEDQRRTEELFTRILASFRHMPFTALSPAGWEDSATFWGGPDALMKRMEWANTIATLERSRYDAVDLSQDILLPDEHLLLALTRAESDHQAMTLLLASPAFQWR